MKKYRPRPHRPAYSATKSTARNAAKSTALMATLLSAILGACTPSKAETSEQSMSSEQTQPTSQTGSQTSSQLRSSSFGSINIASFKQKVDAGAYVLDVRTPAEFAAGHVGGAVLLPLDELPARLAEVPSDRTVYVFCRSGNRSAAASKILTEAGKQAVNVEGGMNAWQAAGYAVAQP